LFFVFFLQTLGMTCADRVKAAGLEDLEKTCLMGTSNPASPTTKPVSSSPGMDYMDYQGTDYGFNGTIPDIPNFPPMPQDCTDYYNSADFQQKAAQCDAEKNDNQTTCPSVCLDLYKGVPQSCIDYGKEISAQFSSTFGSQVLDLSNYDDPCVQAVMGDTSTNTPVPSPSTSTTITTASPSISAPEMTNTTSTSVAARAAGLTIGTAVAVAALMMTC